MMTLFAVVPPEVWAAVASFLFALSAFLQYLSRRDMVDLKAGAAKRDVKIDDIKKSNEESAKVNVASHSLLNSISLTKAVRFAQKCDEVAKTDPTPENKRDAEVAWQEVRDHQERQVLFDDKLRKNTIEAEQRKEAAEKIHEAPVAPDLTTGKVPITMEVGRMDVDQFNAGGKKP